MLQRAQNQFSRIGHQKDQFNGLKCKTESTTAWQILRLYCFRKLWNSTDNEWFSSLFKYIWKNSRDMCQHLCTLFKMGKNSACSHFTCNKTWILEKIIKNMQINLYLTSSVNFLKAAQDPSKSNGKSSFFPKIFGKNLFETIKTFDF